MMNYGKLEFINIDKNGKCYSEKLHFMINSKQKRALLKFIQGLNKESKKCKISTSDFSLCNNSDSLKKFTELFTEIVVEDLYFCAEQREVYVRNIEIHLTVKEFDILALLIMHPKRVFTYEIIMDLVWHEDYTFYSRKAINNHVSNLRKKLKIAPDVPDYIKSVYGVGYKFEV